MTEKQSNEVIPSGVFRGVVPRAFAFEQFKNALFGQSIDQLSKKADGRILKGGISRIRIHGEELY